MAKKKTTKKKPVIKTVKKKPVKKPPKKKVTRKKVTKKKPAKERPTQKPARKKEVDNNAVKKGLLETIRSRLDLLEEFGINVDLDANIKKLFAPWLESDTQSELIPWKEFLYVLGTIGEDYRFALRYQKEYPHFRDREILKFLSKEITGVFNLDAESIEVGDAAIFGQYSEIVKALHSVAGNRFPITGLRDAIHWNAKMVDLRFTLKGTEYVFSEQQQGDWVNYLLVWKIMEAMQKADPTIQFADSADDQSVTIIAIEAKTKKARHKKLGQFNQLTGSAYLFCDSTASIFCHARGYGR